VLLSATCPPPIEELARSVLHDHLTVIVGQKNGVCANVKQDLVYCGKEEGKIVALRGMFQKGLKFPALLFVQSKDRAQQLYEHIKKNEFGIAVGVIHADQPLHEVDSVV
jgi:ATP-dependent RNA helicase DDX52/ROK1